MSGGNTPCTMRMRNPANRATANPSISARIVEDGRYGSHSISIDAAENPVITTPAQVKPDGGCVVGQPSIKKTNANSNTRASITHSTLETALLARLASMAERKPAKAAEKKAR